MSAKNNEKAFAKYAKRIIAALMVMVAATGGFLYYSYQRYETMRSAVMTETIYPGITIHNIDVGGATKEEAEQLLNETSDITDKKITLLYEDKKWMYSYGDFDAQYAVAEAVAQAYEIGRDGTVEERYAIVSALANNPQNVTMEYHFDPTKIDGVVQTVASEINIEPRDATLTRTGGNFVIEPEQWGLKLNTEKSAKDMESLISTAAEGELLLTVEKMEPSATKEMFSYVKDVIGSFSTSYANSSYGRAENLRVGSSKINGRLLMPDEVFSTNEALGPQTAANGYQPAPVIVNGKLEDGLGGGVCQLSSTLYNAVLMAELDIVERRNHSLPVTYVPLGRDATLAGDYIDFKFRNSTPYPIYIENYMANAKLTMNIYGHEIHNSGRTLEFTSATQTTAPPAEKIIQDENLPEGERVVVTQAKSGSHVQTYKTVYENGVLKEKYKISDSTYRATAGEVRVGTKKVTDQTPDPVEPPAAENNDTGDNVPPAEPVEIPADVVAEEVPADVPAEETPANNPPVQQEPVDDVQTPVSDDEPSADGVIMVDNIPVIDA